MSHKCEHMHEFYCYDLEKYKEIMNPNLFSINYACIFIIGFIINLLTFVYSNFNFIIYLIFYI